MKKIKYILNLYYINTTRIYLLIAVGVFLCIYASIDTDFATFQLNKIGSTDSIPCLSKNLPTSDNTEHPTCPSDTEWVETENEDEATIHIYVLRPEAPTWQIQTRYSIQNNQACSVFQPEYTPPPPRQIA